MKAVVITPATPGGRCHNALNLRFFALFAFAEILFASSACNPLSDRQQPLPSFNHVTTDFLLTRSRIRGDQRLEVSVTFRNIGVTRRSFRFFDFAVDAKIFSKGELVESLCGGGLEFPLEVLTLEPGEVHKMTEELDSPVCRQLAPGRYSIRFYYNLKAIENDSERAEYNEMYGRPEYGLVPWDGREHDFTVVK